MRVLLTGMAGFIGFHAALRFLARGDEVIGVDSINDYYDSRLKFARLGELGFDESCEWWGSVTSGRRFPGLSFVRARLEDAEAMRKVFALASPDLVVHLAAQAGVRYSIDHPREYTESNVSGFLSVLEGCRNPGVGHLVFASSSSVYGLNRTRPFGVHDHADHPVSLYAATKKANELMAHAYAHLYRIPATGLRFFTVYGPWGRPDMAYYSFARDIVAGKPIRIFNHGDLWRDFTFVDDIVEGILRVSDDPPPAENPLWDPANPDPASSSAPYRLFNIGNNRPVRLTEFVDTLERALGRTAMRHELPMQPGDVYATEADIDDLERRYDWRPTTTIDEGLGKFVEWFLAEPERRTWK